VIGEIVNDRRKSMTVFLKLIGAGLMFILLCTGCQNTVQGFGKDMENSGQEIQKAVSDSKKSS
jgi:predicted small secreted protein